MHESAIQSFPASEEPSRLHLKARPDTASLIQSTATTRPVLRVDVTSHTRAAHRTRKLAGRDSLHRSRYPISEECRVNSSLWACDSSGQLGYRAQQPALRGEQRPH